MSIKATDCKSYHLILAQGSGEDFNKINPAGYNFVHIDAEYSEFTCVECHTGGPQK